MQLESAAVSTRASGGTYIGHGLQRASDFMFAEGRVDSRKIVLTILDGDPCYVHVDVHEVIWGVR